MNKPLFEINDKIINIVAIINNKLGKLEVSIDNKKNVMLRKASNIKSVKSSCAIEANTLTENEVEDIVNGKKIIAPKSEVIEIKNAYNAYTKIYEYKPYDIESFLKAHKNLTENLLKDSGKFRTGDVAVYDNEKVIHIGARPQFVYDLVKDLFLWASTSELNTLIKACVVHYEIETIHPFSDGNGRIGRLWQSVILHKYNALFELMPIETLVYENQQKYYDAIEISRKNNSSTAFIEFMLDMLLKTINCFTSEENPCRNKIKDKYSKLLTNKEMEVLNVIVVNFNIDDYITITNLSNKLNISSSSIRNYLKKFTVEDILVASGENKGRKYKINENILNK